MSESGEPLSMKRLFAIALTLVVITVFRSAEALPIEADVSGNWYNPEQSGHGLQIEVLDLSQALVAWYSFDPEGQPVWLFGMGAIQGDTLHADLMSYSGTAFPPDFVPSEIQGEPWGQVVFRRTGCDTATVEWSPERDAFEAGQMDLQRLTRIDGLTCAEDWSQTTIFHPGRAETPHFEALFLDYPDGSEDFYELSAGPAGLPTPWVAKRGFRISGNNHSDDLKMVLMRPLDGLEPETTYRIELEMQFATREPEDCFGVGGSPGDSVYLRMGAAGRKPGFLVDEAGDRRADLDLGNQANPGEDAVSVGDMTNGADGSLCGDPDRPWRLKRLSTTGQPFEVVSDENGRIWVYGLSDSGFEATTTWYLTEFVVRVARADSPARSASARR